MKITKHDTEVDSNGVMHEIIEQESEDGKYAMGMDLVPVDIYKITTLVDYCRLRYSEINGVLCTKPTPAKTKVSSNRKNKSMSAYEWQLDCEKCELNHIHWSMTKIPEQYNITGFKETHQVLDKALVSFHNSKVWNKELNDKLVNAIKIGNKYLTASGVKINQEITVDWIIQQPIEVKEES